MELLVCEFRQDIWNLIKQSKYCFYNLKRSVDKALRLHYVPTADFNKLYRFGRSQFFYTSDSTLIKGWGWNSILNWFLKFLKVFYSILGTLLFCFYLNYLSRRKVATLRQLNVDPIIGRLILDCSPLFWTKIFFLYLILTSLKSVLRNILRE